MVGGVAPRGDRCSLDSADPGQVGYHDPPAIQHGQPVRTTQDAGRVLGHQHAGAVARHLPEQGGDTFGTLGVQLRHGLVEHEHPRPHHQDARDRDALLLATRQRERVARPQVNDAQLIQRGVDARVHISTVDPEVLEPERELLSDRELGR